jgi:hypothetical protein
MNEELNRGEMKDVTAEKWIETLDDLSEETSKSSP